MLLCKFTIVNFVVVDLEGVRFDLIHACIFYFSLAFCLSLALSLQLHLFLLLLQFLYSSVFLLLVCSSPSP